MVALETQVPVVLAELEKSSSDSVTTGRRRTTSGAMLPSVSIERIGRSKSSTPAVPPSGGYRGGREPDNMPEE
jgi:hypothetical protein